jgi:hypothetical protein
MVGAFEIAPYTGVGDLRFGMSGQEVANILGPPMHRNRNWKGEIEEYREGSKVYYINETVAEIVLMPPAGALYKGIDLLGLVKPVDFLIADDPAPFEYMGTIVFLEIGLALTGFAEPNDPDTTVTAFARGRWERLQSRLVSYQRHP